MLKPNKLSHKQRRGADKLSRAFGGSMMGLRLAPRSRNRGAN